MIESFGTLSQTINGLKKEGYSLVLNIKDQCFAGHQINASLSPDNFEIDKVYRFEGESNPDDEPIVYAVSSRTFGVKGTLVNGYGVSSDETTAALIERL